MTSSYDNTINMPKEFRHKKSRAAEDSPKPAKKSTGKTKPDGDKPKYDRKPKFDGDKPRFDSDKPKYDRKPKFDGDKPRFDGDKPKYDRKPKFDGDKPRFDGDKPKYERKPKFDGEKPRFDGDKPKYDRKPKFDGEKPRFDGDKPKYDRKPKFDGDKPRFDGDKPKYDRKPKFDGEKPRFDGDKPKYDRKPKFDGDKPRFDGDKPKYDRKPKFDGEKPRFDGEKPKYDRKPKFDGEKPRFDGEKPKYDRKPKFDGDKPRFEGEKPKYDRKPKFDGDKPRFDGEKPKYDRKPKFDGDKPRFEGEKPKYDRKPKFDGDKPRFDGDKPKYDRKPKFDGEKPRFDGEKPKRAPRLEQGDADFKPSQEFKDQDNVTDNKFEDGVEDKSAPKGKAGKFSKGKSHLDPKSRNAQRRKELSTPKAPEHTEGMRLNKYVAHCGVASRRETAELIKEGKVTVNNVVVKEPFYQIKPGDVVHYKGKAIRPEGKMVYLLMNKPRNVITTTDDERGRKTVLDLVEKKTDMRVFPVGRLDRDTTGLLLLTNDGELAQKMTHPSYKIKKIYHAVLNRPINQADLEKIRTGLELEDGLAPVDSVDFVPDKPRNEVGITIHIGRNRIVRRIFAHLGYDVERLDRTYLGGLTKKDLPRGFVRHLNKQEVIMLKHFTGK